MISEMVLSAEALVADVTRVRSLVGVRPLVNEQVVRLAEVTRAEATDVLLLGPVSSDKHGESTATDD